MKLLILFIRRIIASCSIVALLAPSVALADDFAPAATRANDPVSLVQSVDGTTPLAVGGLNPTATVFLLAQVSQTLATGQTDELVLEAEVQKTDTAFNLAPNYQSNPVSFSGAQVSATLRVAGLTEGNYHWQARVRNLANQVSNWVVFGANLDTPLPAATDFRVDFPPGMPTAVSATTCQADCASTHAVFLAWTNPTDPDLDRIEIWRSTALESAGLQVASVATPGVRSIDSGLSQGTIYYYRLRAIDRVGNPSGFSDPVATVTNIVIDDAEGSRVTKIGSWSTVGSLSLAAKNSGANLVYRPAIPTTSVYEVFVAWVVSPAGASGSQATDAKYTVSTPDSSTLLTVDQTKLADQLTKPAGSDVPSGLFKLGTFTLAVGTGNTVRLDATATGFVVADTAKFVYLRPVPPSNLVATDRPNDNGGAILLTWTASSSATAVATNVYRSSVSGQYDFSKPLATAVGTSFNDETVVNDLTYFYVIRAADRTRESVNSNETSGVAKDNLAPAAPTIVSVESGDGFAILGWTAVSDATGYVIRYRDPATEAGFHTMLISGGGTTSTKITDLTNDVEHEFGVAARDAAGNESPFEQARATPKGPKVEPKLPKVVTAGLVGRAKAAAIEPALSAPTVEAAEEGKIKAAETARARNQRVAVTLAILVIAIGAGVLGYYGYDWWLRQAAQKPKVKGKNGRW